MGSEPNALLTRVCSCHCEDDATRFGDVLHEHIANLPFNVAWLVANGDLRETRQVDQSEGQNVRGVDAEVNGVR